MGKVKKRKKEKEKGKKEKKRILDDGRRLYRADGLEDVTSWRIALVSRPIQRLVEMTLLRTSCAGKDSMS